MKFSSNTKKLLDNAVKNAKEKNHEFVTPEHILFTALTFKEIKMILYTCGADLNFISESLQTFLNEKIPTVENQEPLQSFSFNSVLERAVLHGLSAEKKQIELSDILVSIYEENQNHGSYFLKKSGITHLGLLEAITCNAVISSDEENQDEDSEYENKIQDTNGWNELQNDTEESEKEDFPKNKKKSILERFTRNLTEEAEKGLLEPLISRQEEIEHTIQILCRRRKNNPPVVPQYGENGGSRILDVPQCDRAGEGSGRDVRDRQKISCRE